MNYLPINININNKKCLVFGAGAVAARKIQMLRKVGARVTCIGSDVNQSIQLLSAQSKIHLIQTNIETHAQTLLRSEYLRSFKLIISATNNKPLAQKIHKLCESNNILLNTVDDRTLCNYISPAIVNRHPIIVAISSSGTAPVLARKLREEIEKMLPQGLGLLAEKAQALRNKVKRSIHTLRDRKMFWERFFSSSTSEAIINKSNRATDQELIANIKNKIDSQGEVVLVGAGPGDPDLLTIKALRVMQNADIVYHDKLVSKEILELVRRDAELVCVGKSQGNHSVSQEHINHLLVEQAQKGKRVCRLKGGDPFVFGRGGEEIQELKKQGIKFQIVPGITAAIGCSAYAGIPLTHRDYAQNVLFVTAHCKNSIDTLDWKSMAREKQTIVVYMGLMKSQYLSENLINQGKNPKTPIVLIENGTNQNQRVIRSTLINLHQTIVDHQIVSPALIVIGEVAALSDDFQWYNTQNHEKFMQPFLNKIA